MARDEQVRVAYYSPNILNVCVDQYENGDFSGRMYHRYGEAPRTFRSIIDLTNQMEAFFDRISFPQAATQTRSFSDGEKTAHKRSAVDAGGSPEKHEKRTPPERVVTLEDLMAHRGEKGTFYIGVRYRQNACWQGELEWAEQKKTMRFASILDMIKLINNAVDVSQITR